MARNLIVLVLVLLAVANLFHGSTAQTRHVVGDTTGWTIPSGGASFYVNWTAKKTFTVGDTLVFNFANGQHNVAKVTKSAFDGCNGANTLSMLTSGPASVPLNETGEQHFICTVGTHCSLGQKLSINVVKASTSPVSAPQPSASPPKTSTTPVKAPAPAPTTNTTKTPSPAPAKAPSAATPPSASASGSPSPSSSSVNPSSPSPNSALSPPPENSDAASLGVAGLFATVLSIAAAFLY